jgi:hypothetical protein
VIGRVERGDGVQVHRSDGSVVELPPGGWQHFGASARDLVRRARSLGSNA